MQWIYPKHRRGLQRIFDVLCTVESRQNSPDATSASQLYRMMLAGDQSISNIYPERGELKCCIVYPDFGDSDALEPWTARRGNQARILARVAPPSVRGLINYAGRDMQESLHALG